MWKVTWQDASGVHYSDWILKWTDAELYRIEIGGNAAVLRY